MSMDRGFSMQNGFIDPMTLNFYLLSPKAYHFEYPEVIPCTKFDLGSLSYKQTDRQADGLERTTHARRPLNVLSGVVTFCTTRGER